MTRKVNPLQWGRLQSMAIKDRRVTDAQLRTLSAISVYADRTGRCYPSMETLEADLGKSRQTISLDVKRLEELGYIRVTRKHHAANHYQLYAIDSMANTDAPYYSGRKKPRVKPHFTPDVKPRITPDVKPHFTLTSQSNNPSNNPLLASVESSPSAVSIPPSSENQIPAVNKADEETEQEYFTRLANTPLPEINSTGDWDE